MSTAVIQMMACVRISYLLRNTTISRLHFSSSSACQYRKWRIEQGLEPQTNKFGPLTNYPDYSFLDGRPIPLSYRAKQKKEYQRKIYAKILELNNELDVGLEMYHKRQKEEAEAKLQILKNKLKPKGASLLKTNRQKNHY